MVEVRNFIFFFDLRRVKTNWHTKNQYTMFIEKEEILSLKEAAVFLKISKSCLYKKTSTKQIPHFVPGGKNIYFKKSDLEDWIFNEKVTPVSEIELETENYLNRMNKKWKSC